MAHRTPSTALLPYKLPRVLSRAFALGALTLLASGLSACSAQDANPSTSESGASTDTAPESTGAQDEATDDSEAEAESSGESDSGSEEAGVFIPASEVEFEDIIPGVVAFGTVTGDREAGEHGTFVRIPAGQATPLHIHGGGYDAVVLAGNFENPIDGDPNSEVTLTKGSYYHVPGNARHVSRCAADSPVDCLTFFHQDVAFDFAVAEEGEGEASTDGVFTPQAQVIFEDIIPGTVAFATVLGDRETGPHGTFVRVPAGQATPLHVHAAGYRAVVLDGNFENPIEGSDASDIPLPAGSFYQIPADAPHITRCAADSPVDCLTYFYQETAFDFEVSE